MFVCLLKVETASEHLTHVAAHVASCNSGRRLSKPIRGEQESFQGTSMLLL